MRCPGAGQERNAQGRGSGRCGDADGGRLKAEGDGHFTRGAPGGRADCVRGEGEHMIAACECRELAVPALSLCMGI